MAVSTPAFLRSRSAVVACVTLATFTDLVAYSVAVPVLPDLAAGFGAAEANSDCSSGLVSIFRWIWLEFSKCSR